MIGDRIDEMIDLFKSVPSSGEDVLLWVWKLAKFILHVSFGGLVDFVEAVWNMLSSAGAFIKKMITKRVADGSIGVKRHTYYTISRRPRCRPRRTAQLPADAGGRSRSGSTRCSARAAC